MRFSALLAAAAWLAPLAALANRVDPAPLVDTPKASACWTNDYVQQRYGPYAVPPGSSMSIDANQTGCDLLGTHADDLSAMPSADMQKIADECKAAYPNDPYKAIGCAADSVNSYLAQNPGLGTTRCRNHEVAFRQVIGDMNLPGVSADATCIKGAIADPVTADAANPNGVVSPGGHIVSTVTIIGNDGKRYDYVIDTGWDHPPQLLPESQNTCDYLQAHPGSPLPPANRPNLFFGFFNGFGPPTEPGQIGSNVPRDATTTPSGGTPVYDGARTNAGFHH